MTSIIQVAQNHYRTVDSNSLDVNGDIGVIDEFVPYTNPDINNYKSGRKSVVINLSTLNSIEVDARSTTTVNSASTLSGILDKITKE